LVADYLAGYLEPDISGGLGSTSTTTPCSAAAGGVMQKQDHSLLWIKKGATIVNNDREYVIIALADINLVLAKEVSSGEKVLLKIGDIEPPRPVSASGTRC
jgi:hypothetical protein